MNQVSSIEALFRNCVEQSERYLQKQPNNLTACYEIFELAIVSRSQEAWEALHKIYSSRIRSWVQSQSAYHYCEEEIDSCVNAILWKFVKSVPASKLKKFDRRVPAILQYLKTCCVSYVLDCSRRAKPIYQEVTMLDEGAPEPGTLIQKGEMHQELLDVLGDLVKNKQEEIILDNYLCLQIKPKEIHEKYKEHFPTVGHVYRVIGNFVKRCRRDKRLLALRESHKS